MSVEVRQPQQSTPDYLRPWCENVQAVLGLAYTVLTVHKQIGLPVLGLLLVLVLTAASSLGPVHSGHP